MNNVIRKIKNLNKKAIITLSTLFIIIILAIIVGIALARNAQKPYPITAIRSVSNVKGELDIAWKDDAENVIYTVFWSDREGIHIYNRETFKSHKQVVGHRTTIKVPYKYVYFRISKDDFISKEFMNMVVTDTSFCKQNLQLEFLGKPLSKLCDEEKRNITIRAKVLENAEIYRIYHKTEKETIHQDYFVEDLTDVNMKIPVFENSVVFISFFRYGGESKLEFLWHSDEVGEL